MKTLDQETSEPNSLQPTVLQPRTLDAFLSELRHLGIRLWVEGDRLRYKAAKAAMTPDLLAELRDRKPEILAFLRTASLAADPSAAAIPVISRDGSLPLSISQERLWYHHQFEPNSSLNNIITAYRIKGQLDLKLLDRVQHEIVQRHEILRTTFPSVDGKPTVAIAPEWQLTIPIEDLQAIPAAERDEVAHQRAIAESRRPYDLATGPLLRLRLLQLEPDDYLLVFTMHRMMADGVSVDIVFREIVTLYEAHLTGQPAPLPELPIQYVDYAHWQRQRLQGEFLDSHLRYWKEHLSAPLPTLNLPVSRARPSTYSFNTRRRRLIFSRRLNDALNTLSQGEEATLFMTLMAALKVLLYRYSGQEDVMICCSNAGRNRAEIEHLVGPFFNTLALRTQLGGNPTFREVLRREKQVVLGAFAHQELPFEQLVPELDTSQNRGRSSLFQVFFALNPSWKDGNTLSTVELPDITFDTMFGYLYTGKTKFDLFLVIREAEEGLQLLFEYNSDLFASEVILPIMDHFQTLLESIVANPDDRIAQLALLTPEAKQQLVGDWSQMPPETLPSGCLHQQLEVQVEKTPDAIALLANQQQLTYRQLNDRANQLAHYLRAQGANPDQPIALCLESAIDQLIGTLAILKAGGAYLTLEPGSSQDFQAQVLDAAQPHLVITQSSLKAALPPHQVPVILLDTDAASIADQPSEPLVCLTTPQSLAAVFYKAGADGQLQQICLTHQNLLTHSADLATVYALTGSDRVLSGLDPQAAIVEGCFPAWLQGATAILCPDLPSGVDALRQFIQAQAPTVLQLPTTLWYELSQGLAALKQPLPAALRLVVVGGAKVSLTAYQNWLQQVGSLPRWLNTYSTPEASFTVTVFDPATAAENLRELPELAIGRPLPHTQVYILDHELQPVPVGALGELYIGGQSLASGSLKARDYRNEQFISHPFTEQIGAQLYKTGEIARYHPDGTIEWVSCPDPQIASEAQTTARVYVRSRDETEEKLTALWEEVLGIQPIGIQDNFFDLGGHSLLAVRLFAEIEKHLGKNLPLSVLLQAPTIAQLAAVLREDSAAAAWSPLVEIQAGTHKPPLFCMHGGGFNVLIYRDLAIRLGPDQPVYGLQARGLREGESIADRLEEMATDYIQEIRRVQPKGPYYLSGLSNGGNIALEMAQQLHAQGEEVALLAMFDTSGPNGMRLLPSVPRFASSLNYLARYQLSSCVAKVLNKKWLLSSLQTLLQAKQQRAAASDTQSVAASSQPSQKAQMDRPAVRSLQDAMDWVSQYVLGHSPWAFLTPKAQLQGVEGSLSERLQKLEEAYAKAHAAYTPEPYAGKIILFRAEECPPGYQRDFYLGWKNLASGGVDVYQIPGHHTSLMVSPILADQMQACLAAVHNLESLHPGK